MSVCVFSVYFMELKSLYVTDPGLHIQTESCCRRCKELDQGRCGSLGCRSSYQRSGHEEHGVDDCEANQRKDKRVKLCERRNMSIKTVNERFSLLCYLKVPRSTSCPLRRTWIPSLSREPKAMYSPRAQSHTRWLTIFARPFRIRLKPKRWTQQRLRLKRDRQYVQRISAATGGERTAPPCMVKSSTGTEAAMFPMWLSSSSLMPVGGQLIVLGCPSSVKKSADKQTLQVHRWKKSPDYVIH